MIPPGELVRLFYVQRRRVRRFQNDTDVVRTLIVRGGDIEIAGSLVHVGLGPQRGTELVLELGIVDGRQR